MSNFSSKLEHLLSSRAEIISNMENPRSAEGNDLEKLTGQRKGPSPEDDINDSLCWPDDKASPVSVILPPLETFMEVPEQIRHEHFFITAVRGDILTGYVSAIQESGLIINILSCDCGPRRDFEGMKLTGFLPQRQIFNSRGGMVGMDTFQMNDRLRTFILDIGANGRLILSTNPKGYPTEIYGDVKLGHITEEDLPLHYKKLQALDNKTFEECLEGTAQFQNPDCIGVLCKRFSIPRSSVCSLLHSYNKLTLPKAEMACELRRSQLRAMSMKRVAQGVRFFKEERNTEALQCYNFAIELEDTNPDAYVARGALYASSGNFTKAIDDFEKALEYKPTHTNAKNYLGQTLVAYANEIQTKDSMKSEKFLKRAIKLDRSNKEARSLLRSICGTDKLSDEEDLDEPPKELNRRNARAWSRSRSRSPTHGEELPPFFKNSNTYQQRKGLDIKQPRTPSPPASSSRNRDRDTSRDYDRRSSGMEDMDKPVSKTQRRVYTPPKNVRATDDGTLSKYENRNDLPTSSKVLQERLQAKLAAIERRHESEHPPVTRRSVSSESEEEESGRHQQPPRQNLWVPPPSYDHNRRGSGGNRPFFRRDHYDKRNNYVTGRYQNYQRDRSPGNRYHNNNNFYDDRNRGYYHNSYHDRGRGYFQRRPFRSRGGYYRDNDRRERRRSQSSQSRSSSSSSKSGSARASDESPVRRRRDSSNSPPPTYRKNKNANVTRAVLDLPELASLEKSNRLTDNAVDGANLAEVDSFVAQLKAKRQTQPGTNNNGAGGGNGQEDDFAEPPSPVGLQLE